MTDTADTDVVEVEEWQPGENAAERKWIADAREMLDFLEEHLRLVPRMGIQVHPACITRADLTECVREMGSGTKVANDYWYGLAKEFGQHSVRAVIGRDDACESVPTGKKVTRTITAAAGDPIPDGAKNVRPKALPSEVVYEIEEDEVERVCPPVLAGAVADDALTNMAYGNIDPELDDEGNVIVDEGTDAEDPF